MQLSTLKSQIKNNTLDNLYIFTGPEIEVQRIYINELSKITNKPIKRYDSVESWSKNIHSTSLIKSSNIVLVFNDKYFLLSEQLQSKITQNITFHNDILILVYDSIDKRSRLYKTFTENIVEFDYLKADVLERYVAKDIELDSSHCKRLVETCENDYSRIRLEIDKIKAYSEATSFGYNESMDYLLRDGVIYEPPYDAIFDFVDAVLKRKYKLAFNLLQQSYDSGESTMVIISNLYNSTKQLLQVQAYNGNDISSATGLTPFQIKLARGRVGIYHNSELVNFMKILRYVERSIKVGSIEDPQAISYALVQLWNVAS